VHSLVEASQYVPVPQTVQVQSVPREGDGVVVVVVVDVELVLLVLLVSLRS